MPKPKASKKDIVTFKAAEDSTLADKYPDGHDLEFAAIVNRGSEGDDAETGLTVFLEGGGIRPESDVPHSNYASDGAACWKKGS